MILTGNKILEEVQNKNIIISPFDEKQLNPNSYNFKMGDTVLTYVDKVLDPKKNHETVLHKIPPEGMILQPDVLYLSHTVEVMGSEKYVPIIRGRSSIGRLGIFINITADLIDIGSINQWTLQLHVVQPVRVYPDLKIGQVTFWEVSGGIKLYKGKYQGSRGPIPSKIHQDFNEN